MPAPLSSDLPTIEAIEAEFDDIWPDWIKAPNGAPGNPRRHPRNLPELWQRRVKWLLKAHSLHRQIGESGLTLAEEGWRPQLVTSPRTPGHWFCHVVPPDQQGQPRPVDVPRKVKGPPRDAGAVVAASAAPTAAQLAVMTGRPLALVKRALSAMPAGEDPRVWVADWTPPVEPKGVAHDPV